MKFLLDNYRKDSFLSFIILNRESSREDYTSEFEYLMLRCDVVDLKEQAIAHYLGRLRAVICDVVQLQLYWTFNDVGSLKQRLRSN